MTPDLGSILDDGLLVGPRHAQQLVLYARVVISNFRLTCSGTVSDPAAPVAFGQCKVGTDGNQTDHERNIKSRRQRRISMATFPFESWLSSSLLLDAQFQINSWGQAEERGKATSQSLSV
jgi:hypothetical protein